jgi:hypothetical protein
VEQALSQLLIREIKLHLKLENLKRTLGQMYDFCPVAAFKSVDDKG